MSLDLASSLLASSSSSKFSQQQSNFEIPIVSYHGKEILERFTTHNGLADGREEFYVVSPTPQQEYRLLKYLESQREIQVIDLLEANRLGEARIIERRLDATRERMKSVEVLCRYTQSVYSSVLAAQQPNFHPDPTFSSPTTASATGNVVESTPFSISAVEQEGKQSSRMLFESGNEQEEEKEKQQIASVLGTHYLAPGATDMLHQPSASGPITTRFTPPVPFVMDAQSFRDSGYCLLFSCERFHHERDDTSSNNTNEMTQTMKPSFPTINNKSNNKSNNNNNPHHHHHHSNKKAQKHLFQLLQQQSAATSPSPQRSRTISRLTTSFSELPESPSMKEFLTTEMKQIWDEVEAQKKFLKEEEIRTGGGKYNVSASRKRKAAEKTTNEKEEKEEDQKNGDEEEKQEEKQQEKEQEQEQKEEKKDTPSIEQHHQISFSCDARIDDDHVTAESERLATRLRSTIHTSLEKLPLADWGDVNRIQGTESAILASLDSLFGLIVAKDKESAEDFFKKLKKSEMIGIFEQDDENDDDENDEDDDEESSSTSTSTSASSVAKKSLYEKNKNKKVRNDNNNVNNDPISISKRKILNSIAHADDEDAMQYGAPSAPPTFSKAPKHPTDFVHQNTKQKRVGKFTKVLARVIPAGGSRACSDVLKQLSVNKNGFSSFSSSSSSSSQQQQQQNNNNNKNSVSAGSGASAVKKRKNRISSFVNNNNNNNNNDNDNDSDELIQEPPTAWWMKTVNTPTIELSGLVDTLQRIITECEPFVPQYPKNMMLRGGTVSGTLFSPDDKRAAALCIVLDGDCGFEFNAQDVLLASKTFSRVVEAYYGEVVQTFGDYATAIFWSKPQSFVLDEYEQDDDATTILGAGIPLNRLSPTTRAVLAGMELQKQIKNACCAISLSDQHEKTEEELEQEKREKLMTSEELEEEKEKQRRFRNWEVGSMRTIIYGPEPDSAAKEQMEIEKKKLQYNARSHTTPLVTVAGSSLDEAVRLALLSEKTLRRTVVISANAAKECDSAMTRLIAFSHDLIEYFTPISLESTRLEEPPAERLVGKYEAGGGGDVDTSAYDNKKKNASGDDSLGVDFGVDLSQAVASSPSSGDRRTGFQTLQDPNKRRVNFHSIHSEPTLRRLFVNLEPYRGCGYILRRQLKEVLYPLCMVDPLRVQAGSGLESELAALARKHFEEREEEKYRDTMLAAEAGAVAGTELSPMEAMRLMLLKARKEQRAKQKQKEKGSSNIGGNIDDISGGDGSPVETLRDKLRDQSQMQEKVKSNRKQQDRGASPILGGKQSLFSLEDGISGVNSDSSTSKKKKGYEVVSDVHADVHRMYKEIFGIDLAGVTHDVLDTMLAPLRNNEAAPMVSFSEFLLFCCRLQAE